MSHWPHSASNRRDKVLFVAEGKVRMQRRAGSRENYIQKVCRLQVIEVCLITASKQLLDVID